MSRSATSRGLLVRAVEAAGRGALPRDLVVDRREVEVERLRDRPAGNRLHLVRERRERRPLAAEVVRRVDRDLALDAADVPERVRDRARRHGHEDGIGRRDVPAARADLLHLVAATAPQLRQAAAHVTPTDHCDVHAAYNGPSARGIPAAPGGR